MTPEDRLAIIEVQHLYGHVLDRGLWSRLGELFTADGVFDPSDVGLPAMTGLAEIQEKLIPLEERSRDRCHHAGNIVIMSTGADDARVLSKYLCNHATGVIAYGEYEDRMVRTANGWRIAQRKTRRRALGIGEAAASSFTIDWPALLDGAPPAPPLVAQPAPDLDLADRLALLELASLYGHVLDRGLWDRIGEVFGPDAVYDATAVGLPLMTGRETIRRLLIPLEEAAGPRRCHHTTNAIVVEGGGNRARMLSKYICSSPHSPISYGEYEDDCIRTEHGWRIQRRKALRRATGTRNVAGTISIDWDGLLANTPPPPELAPPQPPHALSSADRLAIWDLLARYGHMFDHWQSDRIDEVFTPDGIFDPSSVGLTKVVGIDAFRETFFFEDAAHPRDGGRAHHGTDIVICDAGPDWARVLSKYIVRHRSAAIAFGEYEDDLVRTAAGWRIARRKTFRRALALGDPEERFAVDANGRMVGDGPQA